MSIFTRVNRVAGRYQDTKLFIAFGVYAAALYAPLIRYGGLIYDDWSVAGGARACPGIIGAYKCFWGNYTDRPLTPLYLSVLSNLFHDHAPAYYLLIITCWLAGVIILYFIFKRRFGRGFAIPFMFLAAVPSISSTIIFSPAMQGMGAFTFLVWAVSFYLLDNYLRRPHWGKLVGSFALIFCVMILYESSLPLFGLWVAWPLIAGPRPDRLGRAYWWGYFKKFILPILGIMVVVLAYQKLFIVHFGNDVSKFRILHDANAANFGMRILVNDVYIFALGVVNFSGRGLLRILRNNSLVTIGNLLFASGVALWAIIYQGYENRAERAKPRPSLWPQLLAVVLILLGIAAIHFVAVSPPTIVGYLNRGMVSGSIVVALVFAALWQRVASRRLWIGVLWALFFIGYLSSFMIQRNNYIAGNRDRERIQKQVVAKLASTNQDSMFVLAEAPTYEPNNFDNETIFSDEVLDWGNFLHNKAANHTTGGISLSTERLRRGELEATPKGLHIMKSFDVDLARLWYYDIDKQKLVKITSEDQLKEILKNIKLNPVAYPLPVDAQLRNTIRDWLASY